MAGSVEGHRAGDDGAGAAVESKQGEIQLVTFRLGKEEYGVDIMQVREIIRPVPITRIPDAGDLIEGVMELRNEVIPVLDLRRRFMASAAESGKEDRIVVASVSGTTMGLVVDAVSEVLRVSRGAIEPVPDIVQSAQSDCLKGIARLSDRLVIIMDLESLLCFNGKAEAVDD